ncbi:TetR family transcriptional regulator [Mycobacterium lentiflavum]|uniref:TetR family transcriptional regulator n=1 Tax=Mycobacterium lentiflavum TaxID=141349 RepID=A0A0E4GZ63_MYCLN|nr:TetR/AcrR family transcriptional regulator [Mycobacterium lentiflavum]CQD17740.1 TetR family transcriptional regulator [Mycobacterium lentiflavum]
MPRRPRRTTPEVRHLILQAARERFAAVGFAGATTIAIAQSADVSETVLFRHFPTKERLFEAAVVEPFEEYVGRYTEGWRHLPVTAAEPATVLREYAAALYDIVASERELFAALMARGLHSDELAAAFAMLDEMAKTVAEAYNLDYDGPIAVRAAFMMVMSTSVFHESLFAGTDGMTRDRIVGELGEMLVGAALHRRRQ